MATQVNLAFDAGEDWVFNSYAFEADGQTPLNLTGATIQLQISPLAGGTAVVTPSQVTVTPTAPTLGQTNLTIPVAQQTNAGVGVYLYALRVTLSSGRVCDLNYGKWTVNANAFNFA